MGTDVRLTGPVIKVLAAMLTDVEVERYGLDLMRDTGLASGTLYPILARLEQAGWIASEWEDIDPAAEGRPARKYYLLTPHGATDARVALAELHQQMSRATGVTGSARTA